MYLPLDARGFLEADGREGLDSTAMLVAMTLSYSTLPSSHSGNSGR